MSTAVKWSTSASRVLQAQTRARWQELSQGVTLVVLGYLALLVLVLPGSALIWLAHHGPARLWLTRIAPQQEAAFYFGILLTGVGAFLGHGLIVAGQWRCLGYAPHQHRARGWMLGAFLALVAGSVVALGVQLIAGGRAYGTLPRALEGLGRQEVFRTGGPLQLAGVALGVFSLLLYTRYLRLVVRCFRERPAGRSVPCLLAAVCLLAVATAVAATGVERLTSPADVFIALGGGWLACFLWHFLVVVGARRTIDAALHKFGVYEMPPHSPVGGEDKPKPYSGLHHFYTARIP